MADRFWVGGTDTWNATAGLKWSTTSGGTPGASVPGAGDDAIFDSNSGSGTVSISAPPTLKRVRFTGFSGTFNMNGQTLNLNGQGFLAEDAGLDIVDPGFTWTGGGTISATERARFDTDTKTINSNVQFLGNNVPDLDCRPLRTTGTLSLEYTSNSSFDFTGTLAECHSISFNISDANGTIRFANGGCDTITLTGTGNLWTKTGPGTLTWFNGLTTINVSGTGSSARTLLVYPTFSSGFTGANVNVTAGSGDFTLGGDTVKNLNFTGFSGNLTTTGEITVKGTGVTEERLVLSSSMTVASTTNKIRLNGGAGTGLIRTHGAVINRDVQVDAGSWGPSNQSPFKCEFGDNNTLWMAAGTWVLTGNTPTRVGAFRQAGTATLSLGSLNCLLRLYGNSGLSSDTVWDATNLTLPSGADNWNLEWRGSRTTTNFICAGKTYKTFVVAAGSPTTMTISGSNTFSQFNATDGGTELKFTAGTTNTSGSWQLEGTSGSKLKLRSTTTSNYTLSKSGGNYVVARNVDVHRSTASQTNTWYAWNSINTGSNTNWNFVNGVDVDVRQHVRYFVTRNDRHYFEVQPGIQHIFNPDDETDGNADFVDTGATADPNKATLKTRLELNTP